MLFLLGSTFILGAITGFAISSEGSFFSGMVGQIVQGLLSLVCFTLVGVGFWIYGWKTGVLYLVLVFAGGNAGLSLYRYLRRRSSLSAR